MEINVGDYVRTKDGIIAKIIEMNGYKTLLDRYYFSSCEGNMDNNLYDEDIIKHSKDIINLIEVGDYVNGSLVYEIEEHSDGYDKELHLESSDIGNYRIDRYDAKDKIKTILTHEQFEANAYTIEKER